MKAPIPPPQATFHVAPRGSDASLGTAERPFATIEGARDAVRRINGTMSGTIEVILAGGTYVVEKAVLLRPEDSGANGHDVVYRSRTGERAVVSGGRRIVGWQPGADGIWSAPADLAALRQLYVNGRRARRAAIPAPAGLEEWGNVGYRTQSDAAADWSCPEDIELVYTDMWVYTYCRVASIRRDRLVVEIRMQQPYFTLGFAKEGRPLQGCYPRSIENSLSFLREPGQWYFDRHAKVLHYMPLVGEDLATAEVIVPVPRTPVPSVGD